MYESGYEKLFDAITDVIGQLIAVQQACEELFIEEESTCETEK